MRAQRGVVALLSPLMPGVADSRRTRVTIGGVTCERIAPTTDEAAGIILYLHGGAFCLGSPRSHRSITTRLARDAGLAVIVPDYRLAPEHPWPAALDDLTAVCLALIRQGHASERLVLAGDSAGGRLALDLADRLRTRHDFRVAALALISPVVHLDARRRGPAAPVADPMVRAAWLEQAPAWYRGDDATDPLDRDPRMLPPLLIEVGRDEILLGDSIALARHAAAGDVACALEIHDGRWHAFPPASGLARVLPPCAIAPCGVFSAVRRRRPLTFRAARSEKGLYALMDVWRYRRGTTGATLVAEFAGLRGVTLSRLIAGTGMTEADLHDPRAEILAAQELALIKNYLGSSEVSVTQGFAVGRMYHFTAFGLWGLGSMSCETVADALAMALRFLPMTYVFSDIVLGVRDGTARLTFAESDAPDALSGFLVECDMASAALLLDELCGGRLAVTRVSRSGAPYGNSGCARVAGRAVEWFQERNSIAFAAESLSMRLPQPGRRQFRFRDRRPPRPAGDRTTLRHERAHTETPPRRRRHLVQCASR